MFLTCILKAIYRKTGLCEYKLIRRATLVHESLDVLNNTIRVSKEIPFPELYTVQ